jgi:hypothetical protein
MFVFLDFSIEFRIFGTRSNPAGKKSQLRAHKQPQWAQPDTLNIRHSFDRSSHFGGNQPGNLLIFRQMEFHGSSDAGKFFKANSEITL